MSDIKGRFADYLQESETPPNIQVDLGDETIVLHVPTRNRLREYYAVLNDEDKYREDGDSVAFERAQWAALVGKKLANKMLDYFDERPFVEYREFRNFVDVNWFGKGASDVEGK